jgi:hypothetical protein
MKTADGLANSSEVTRLFHILMGCFPGAKQNLQEKHPRNVAKNTWTLIQKVTRRPSTRHPAGTVFFGA